MTSVDLVDGTYELFRYHFGLPEEARRKGSRSAATRGVVGAVLAMLEAGATHVGVATDHVIESFRNEMWAGYKTSAGVPEDLLAQFPLLEAALDALGVVVWPMVEWEADDALASAATTAATDPAVTVVRIHAVDKDLAQCVEGERVVQVDRRKEAVLDEAGVVARYGVHPESVPDWLALVGDSSDGYPGIPGWGKRTASVVLARYHHLEDIPTNGARWAVDVAGKVRLAATLAETWQAALLFRDLATLRREPPVLDRAEHLRWAGPGDAFAAAAAELGAPAFAERAERLASQP